MQIFEFEHYPRGVMVTNVHKLPKTGTVEITRELYCDMVYYGTLRGLKTKQLTVRARFLNCVMVLEYQDITPKATRIYNYTIEDVQ